MTTASGDGVIIARVFRENWGSWWAEVWVPRGPGNPLPSKPMERPGWPESVQGYSRVGVALRHSRRDARKAARVMRDRYEAGLPCDPADEQPTVEIVA